MNQQSHPDPDNKPNICHRISSFCYGPDVPHNRDVLQAIAWGERQAEKLKENAPPPDGIDQIAMEIAGRCYQERRESWKTFNDKADAMIKMSGVAFSILVACIAKELIDVNLLIAFPALGFLLSALLGFRAVLPQTYSGGPTLHDMEDISRWFSIPKLDADAEPCHSFDQEGFSALKQDDVERLKIWHAVQLRIASEKLWVEIGWKGRIVRYAQVSFFFSTVFLAAIIACQVIASLWTGIVLAAIG